MSNIEHSRSIEDIDKSFGVSHLVEVVCKPRGFNTWCRLPYPNHRNGCPNFGKRADCPPRAPYFLDVYKPEVRVAYLKFDFEEYLNWKKEVHHDWTERALRNPYYFQNHLRAKLRGNIKNLDTIFLGKSTPEYNPEAMGVNIHLTCKNAGINCYH